jgi:23S rRNA (adenine2503-C2)-methyltransferase
MTKPLQTTHPPSTGLAAPPTGFVEKTPLERYVPPAKPSLVGFSRAQLSEALATVGVPAGQRKMRVQQLWHWLYVRGVQRFEEMTSVSKELRAALDRHFTLARPEVVAEQVSVDGTRKWLLRLPGEVLGERPHEVECVYIPEADRGTLCVSSQVGCTLTCSFCHTGTQRLVRNLEASEIVGQILLARDRIGDWPGAAAPQDGGLIPDSRVHASGMTAHASGMTRKITNVVLMGMGEPLYNFDNVRDAMAVAADGDGLAMSKRRITLSTSGVVPQIARWGEEAGTMLAISLHAVSDELRDKLVPINRKYPIAELMAACRAYPGLSNARRITFEYVMLKGVNDSLADAKALVRLLAGIPAKINLIPFNPWPGTAHECSDWEQIERFAEVVNQAGYASPVRMPRGRDIMAACGQLKSESVKISARERALAADDGAGSAQ